MGVVQVSFVITDGQYSLNKKETSDENEIVGEEGLYPIVGASADDNFTIEDQHEPPERQNNLVFISNRSEWLQASAKHFTRELNKPGDGKGD